MRAAQTQRARIVALAGLFGAAFAVAATPAPAEAVVVTPTALYIDHTQRTGTLTLINNSSRAAEISISFMFGYPVSDEHGRVSVPLTDASPVGEPGAETWLRAFPRRLVLEPGQRQTVRVMANPPADLADGEYWGRVIVTSRGTQEPIEQQQGDVQVRLELETAIAVAVSYRKGAVETGVNVTGVDAVASDEGILFDIDLEREGNAAFLGRVRGRVLNANGEEVADFAQNVAVYRTIRRRIEIPFGDATTEGLRIEYVVEPVRPDLPSRGPLPAAEVRGVAEIRGS